MEEEKHSVLKGLEKIVNSCKNLIEKGNNRYHIIYSHIEKYINNHYMICI